MFLKKVNSEDNEVIKIAKSSFRKMNLADCYNHYGQTIGHHDAGDYSIHNSASDAKLDCLIAIEKQFNLEGKIYAGKFESEDVSSEQKAKINEFIEQWEAENASYQEVLVHTYWDGGNWKSIIIECDFDDPITHQIISHKEKGDNVIEM